MLDRKISILTENGLLQRIQKKLKSLILQQKKAVLLFHLEEKMMLMQQLLLLKMLLKVGHLHLKIKELNY